MEPRTLHITNSWHERSGGIATFYRALIEEANRRGRQIRLIVPGEADRVEAVGKCGRIYHVKAPPAPFNSHYRIIYPSQFLRARSKLQDILVAERPQLVEICDKYSLNYLGALLRRDLLPAVDFRPVVVGLSCERMDDNFRAYIGRVPGADAFCAAYLKWAYFPFFDHHIANSEYTAQELRAASRGHLTARSTWVRPMGVNFVHLSPSRRCFEGRRRITERCGATEDCIFLVYAGRLAPEKNLKLLFESFLILCESTKHDYRLLIAGEGIERARWEKFCNKQIGAKATFLGHIADPAELAELLANADAFVHPNPREPFGIAPLQAMASGLPLVAPNSGGVLSYANSENAWLVDPDAAAFALTIEELCEAESLRMRRVRNALNTAENFRWGKIAASFLDLYAELCAHQANGNEARFKPEFCSSEAQGFELFWSRKISFVSERAIQFLAGPFGGKGDFRDFLRQKEPQPEERRTQGSQCIHAAEETDTRPH